MGPPSKKAGKKAGPATEEAPEALLQAVVLADSFNKRFRPITLEKPRCLLPLANSPIIEYTLELLAISGVEEVFLFCSAHSQQIKDYIEGSKWSRSSSPFQIHVLHSPSSLSAGDVMRELDMKGLIKTDFVLVSSDIVSNISLQPIIEEHKARKLVDKNCIMTTVLREASLSHRTRPRGEAAAFVTDATGKRILHYEPFKQAPPTESVPIPRDLCKSNETISIQNDLLDCYIDIVSPDVPPLFTENFDWQHIRKDFLHGILMDELYGKIVNCHILGEGYTGRVQSLQTYDAIGKDIVNRWAHPFCPDSNLLDGQTYKYTRGHIYKEKDVILAQSTVVKESTVLGAGTTIAEKTVVGNSIIGRNCIIGKNSDVSNAIIWDNVVVGDNCTIRNCIIADEAHIGDSCTIEPGAIVSFGVVVEKGTHVPYSARYTNFDEDVDGIRASPTKNTGLRDYEDSEDEEEERIETAMSGLYNLPNSSDSSLSDISLSFEDEDITKRARRPSVSSVAGDNEKDGFFREAFTSLLSAIERNHPVDVMILELNGLRMTANAEFNVVRRATAHAVVTHLSQKLSGNDKTKEVVDSLMGKLLPLFNRMIFDVSDQAEFLNFFQRELVGKDKGPIVMQLVGMKLYNEDLCDDDGILKWWNEGNGMPGETPEMAKVRDGARPFVTWIIERADESDEDEEEEEEDSDDE
ncbi:hypothetical protein ABW19_dt0203510 [Dactylella cylindrospora]|nr:hypothetical protein ABW19_dt0203510 [Dactylella cylindrospora]